MTLLGSPIPPKPVEFTPAGAPPGITVNLTALRATDGSDWYTNRPIIKPRVLIVHTNAASVEASTQSQINWANAAPNNTHPHYALNHPTPSKFVPTDRRAIANSTGRTIEEQYGEQDCSFWTIAIETADAGSNNAVNGDYGDFLYDHAELVARIIAYESIVWGFPIEIPDAWNGAGIVTHTEPWPYPYYTTKQGKTCPTATKKNRVLRGDIMPRARQIVDAWTDPVTPPSPPEGDDVQPDIIVVLPTPGVFALIAGRWQPWYGDVDAGLERWDRGDEALRLAIKRDMDADERLYWETEHNL